MVQYSLPPRSSDPDSVELAVDRVSLALAKDFKYFSFLLFIAGVVCDLPIPCLSIVCIEIDMTRVPPSINIKTNTHQI